MLEVRGHKHPLINPRPVDFIKSIDPLDLGRWVDHSFRMIVYDAVSTETTVEVTGPGGMKFGNNRVCNDHYGFGSSLKSGLAYGNEVYGPFANIDPSYMKVTVTINIIREAVIMADKQKGDELYFDQSVDVIHIPRTWHTTTEPQHYRGWGEQHLVWQNGVFTEHYQTVIDLLNSYIHSDEGVDYRIRPIPPINPGDHV